MLSRCVWQHVSPLCSLMCYPHGSTVRRGSVTITIEQTGRWSYEDTQQSLGQSREMSPCSLNSNPTVAPCWQSVGGRARSVGKASIWLSWVCPLYPGICPTAPVHPSSWEKTLPSSNQCLSFKMQWVVADLEL